MQTASFIGFIKALFYMIAFYYIFRFLAKLFLPLIVKKVVEDEMQKGNYQAGLKTLLIYGSAFKQAQKIKILT